MHSYIDSMCSLSRPQWHSSQKEKIVLEFMWNLKDTKYPKYLKNNQARGTIHFDFQLYHKVIGTKTL